MSKLVAVLFLIGGLLAVGCVAYWINWTDTQHSKSQECRKEFLQDILTLQQKTKDMQAEKTQVSVVEEEQVLGRTKVPEEVVLPETPKLAIEPPPQILDFKTVGEGKNPLVNLTDEIATLLVNEQNQIVIRSGKEDALTIEEDGKLYVSGLWVGKFKTLKPLHKALVDYLKR